jgi:uncharacterized protein with NAD-binding domain and iron-sulfur cluster
MTQDKKKRIVILGAGPAGLSAAYGLTATPELAALHDITIYQVGWRAGGKCSTGRSGPTNRIEQNGTHYLFGSYDNCFDLAKTSYDELAAKGIDWFGPYEKAFLPRDLMVFKQFFRGKYTMWPMQLPTNPVEPGTRDGFLRGREYVGMALQTFVIAFLGAPLMRFLAPPSPLAPPRPLWIRALYALLSPLWVVLSWLIATVVLVGWRLLRGLLRLVGDDGLEGLAQIARAVRGTARWLLGPFRQRWLFANRLYAYADAQGAAVIGLVRDKVFTKGLGAIEDIEYRAWLRKHGADEETLYAPFITTWYDAVAAYEYGDPTKPNLAAGVSVNAMYRSLLTFKGHFAYQMRAEIGDSWVAPIFQCLRERGVRFRFFHRVWDLVPGDGNEIDSVEVERQVELKSGDPDSYQPFIQVAGLHCWPAAPLWDQVRPPHPPAGEDIESFYTQWRGPRHSLRRGEDFDTLILALPLDTARTYCRRLIERSEAWRAMSERLPAVETQSIRLWFKPSLRDIGWTLPTPILSAYTKPFSTWEDNGELVTVETWPPDQRPQAMATVFGALPAPPVSPPIEDHGYPARQLATAKRNAMKFLLNDIGPLWPGAATYVDPLGVDWEKLIDLQGGVGPERFQGQYVRANAGPIERYTMARADTRRWRLETGESGYTNLLLAGDWIQNHILIGCVEGAVVAGLQASRAICGSPRKISGEKTGL